MSGEEEIGSTSKLGYIIVASICPLVSAAIPLIFFKNCQTSSFASTLLLAVSTGVLFAIATLDLIPESVLLSLSSCSAHSEHEEHEAEEHHGDIHGCSSIKWAMSGIAFGYLALLCLDRMMQSLGAGHSHSTLPHSKNASDDLPHSKVHKPSVSEAAFIGLALHSLFDGLVISSAFEASTEIGTRVSLALILHKFPDGFILSSLMLAASSLSSSPDPSSPALLLGASRRSWILAIFVCLMTPLGAALAQLGLHGLPPHWTGFMLAFAAGSFLFISATSIVPELFHSAPTSSRSTIFSFVMGYLAYIFLSGFVQHSH